MLHPTEPPILYKFGKMATNQGVIVEIGSWKGLSTCLLAKGSMANNRVPVHAVDTFQFTEFGKDRKINTYPDFEKNIEKMNVKNIIRAYIGESEVVAKSFNLPISVLFIDGSHDYENVLKDVLNWTPKVVEGGWIAFHDTDYEGVMKVIKELILKSGDYSDLNYMGSLIWTQKEKGSNIKNYYNLFKRNFVIGLWNILSPNMKKKVRIILNKEWKVNETDV